MANSYGGSFSQIWPTIIGLWISIKIDRQVSVMILPWKSKGVSGITLQEFGDDNVVEPKVTKVDVLSSYVCFRWRKRFFAMNELCTGGLMILFYPSILGCFFFGLLIWNLCFAPIFTWKSPRIDRRLIFRFRIQQRPVMPHGLCAPCLRSFVGGGGCGYSKWRRYDF